MRTTSFKNVMNAIASAMGLDPDSADLSPKKAAAYTEFINDRVKEGYEWDFWPEITLTEQRYYRENWDNGATYATGDEIYYDGLYYRSLLDANIGNIPDTATTYWEVPTDFDKYIPYQQTGKKLIATVEFVCQSNPKTNPAYPGYLGHWQSENGVQLSDLAGTYVWIRYRPPEPEFTSEIYGATASYVACDLIYLPATGECYKALQSGSGHDPATEPTYWEIVPFPAFLASWVKKAAYADALRKDGQQDKADGEEDRAYDKLEQIHDVIFAQQGTTKRASVEIY